VAEEGGAVSLYTPNGAVLLNGPPARFGFAETGTFTPATAGAGLMLNGQPVTLAGDAAPLAGGTLAAAFAVRDDLAPRAQAQLDAMARDLVERFADPALDPSRAPGAPGLFTDAGAAFAPAS